MITPGSIPHATRAMLKGNAINKSDLREQGAYGLVEASRLLDLPCVTLRSWVVGRSYPHGHAQARSQAMITPAQSTPALLSFNNLIEAYVLRALRTQHQISVSKVRQALRLAERELAIERLLLRVEELRSNAGELFLRHYGELVNLNRSGQLAIRCMLEHDMKRVDLDERQLPVRLYPYIPCRAEGKSIAIDPTIAFGRPVLLKSGVTVEAIVSRIDCGEHVEEIARDYDLTRQDIDDAVLYARCA